MAANRTITRGPLTFGIWEKSIQVSCKHGSEFVFFNRTPNDRDIDTMCRLIEMGASIQAEKIQDALKPGIAP